MRAKGGQTSGPALNGRGRLQCAVLELLYETEVKVEMGQEAQYRLVKDVVAGLYQRLESPPDPHSPAPRAFDVSVRRAIRTLADRDYVRMERMPLRHHSRWACWLRPQAGPPVSYSTAKTIVGAEVRRAILDYVAGPGRQFSFMGRTSPPDPLGHRYGDVLAETAAKLRHDPFNPNFRTAFSRAVRRLVLARLIVCDYEEVAGRKVIRHINLSQNDDSR